MDTICSVISLAPKCTGAPVTGVRKILPSLLSRGLTMLYIALIGIGMVVGGLCYSIEALNREGLELLKD